MSISLKKGEKVALVKENKGLDLITVGLGWDAKPQGLLQLNFDLDASAFCLNRNKKTTCREDFVYYGNTSNKNHTVVHTGDNLTGKGDGDNERIIVKLSALPREVERVVFVVNIFNAKMKGQSFGIVENAFIRIVDDASKEELLRYDLGKEFSKEIAVIFGEIYRDGDLWRFNAIGQGYNGGLAAIRKEYT